MNAQLRPGARFTGDARTAAGQPATNSAVFAVSAATGDEAGPLTLVEEDGGYILKGLTGEKVQALLSPYPSGTNLWWRTSASFDQATSIRVPWTGTVTGINFTIPAA